jgi:hypothetical protein
MMGTSHMNGSTQPQPEQRVVQPMGPETPVAYYQPVAITPGTIKWVAGCLAAALIFLSGLPAAERYMKPAAQSDLDVLSKVVQVLQTGQAETKVAMERLTLAVDNLSGIVNELRQNSAKRMAVPTPKMR